MPSCFDIDIVVIVVVDENGATIRKCCFIMDSVVFVVYLLVKLEKVFFIVIVGSYEESG